MGTGRGVAKELLCGMHQSSETNTYPVRIYDLAYPPVQMDVLRHNLGLPFTFHVELAQLQLLLLLLSLNVCLGELDPRAHLGLYLGKGLLVLFVRDVREESCSRPFFDSGKA